MRIRLLSVLLFCLLSFQGYGQVGNEWIKFNQFYYKIPTAKDGLYRISYDNLLNAGFPVNAIDPRRLQLFHRGAEQAIYIEGEDDAKFDAADFLEFYGQKNDGVQDANLYKPSSAQPHQYFNLYNDTTSYFLTFNPLPVFGSRMSNSTEINVSSIPKEDYHTAEILNVYTNEYSGGATFSDYVQASYFDEVEGWTGTTIVQGQFLDYPINNILQGNQSKGQPQLELMLLGKNSADHQTVISVGANSGALRVISTQNFTGYTKSVVSVPLLWSDIGSTGNLIVRINPTGVNGQPDRVCVSYIKINFPQGFNSTGASEIKYSLISNPSNKSYIEIQNPAANLRLFDITNPAQVGRIRVTSATTLNAVVPNTLTSRKLLATNTTLTPASIKRVSFRQILPAAQDYIIISNRVLMKPALGYADPVREYGGYRASSAGGGYDTLVVDVNLLYDEFNYGETSPTAIYNFMKYLCNSTPPKYLFLIGKGLNVNLSYYRNPSLYPKYKDLVPTAGIPGSDMLFTVGLAGTSVEPAVPTGRITASSPTDVAAYLNKVKEMETLSYDGLWRKNLLHLSGGIHADEPERFKSYLEEFQEVAEGFYLGGKVKAIAKGNTDIQLVNISEEVNKGVDLVTFYGHSAPGSIDFDIGFATDPVLGYNNPAKYPTLLMNGCNAGDFFLNGFLFGEDWINAQKKGAIGFIADASYGFELALKKYSGVFYDVGFGDSTYISKGLGDIQKQIAIRYTSSPSVYDISQFQQMILLGDPSVKLFGAKKPDYEVNDNNLYIESFNGEPITVNTDSFALKMIVRNFGKATKDSLLVSVTRTFNDNSSTTTHQLYGSVKYADTLVFVIKKDRNKGFGNNVFSVKVDSDNEISELNELNNTAAKGFLIPANGTKNVFPQNFAIITDTQANLVFQTTDLLSTERNFLLEVDTVDSFTSGFKKQFTLKGTVLVNQVINLLTQDSLAYYWRTKLADPKPGESEEWTISSFTYIMNGSEGWAQVHFPQYLKNESDGFILDESQRKIKLKESITQIDITTFGSASGAVASDASVKINASEYNLFTQGLGCRNNSINIIAFDKTSTTPYTKLIFGFSDPRVCGREPQVIMNYTLSDMDNGSGDLSAAIDQIATGDSVVIFSIGNAGYASWTANIKTKLSQLGISSAQISALQTGEPVVIFGKKGIASGSATVIKSTNAPANQQILNVSKTITGRATSGTMTSAIIGPALEWKTFSKRVREVEATDTYNFDILGVTLSGAIDTLFTNLTSDLGLSVINANQYPYLKLVFYAQDNINLTATQLHNWIVTYEPVPEGILLLKGNPDQQIVQEGLTWETKYAFVNIGNHAFADSLTVQYEFFNKSTRVSDKKEFKIKAPLPSDTTQFIIGTQTNGRSGLNDVNVFVNPYILSEQYYDNNLIELSDHLNVEADIYGPILEVTIDGRQVENGDFVSPNPNITLTVWDENNITLKTDTLGINLYLKYPCETSNCGFERINFSDPPVQWFPETETSNFSMIYKPADLPEGEYTLKAEAKDANGNSSGVEPYQITFNVKYEDSIVFYNPHPNPSNSSFYFSFLSTGKEAPEYMSLQIESIDGREVNSFHLSQNEFRVGLNNLIWDGRDQSGHEQPAGVYVYHLLLKVGTKTIRKNGKLIVLQ